MALPSQFVRQKDFSAGEVDENAERRDDTEQVRAAGRVCANWRIMGPGSLRERPGRNAVFPRDGRTETILLPGDLRFRLSFGDGSITIRDATGAVVAQQAGYPWSAENANRIVHSVINRDVLMTFPGSRMKVARRETDGTWSFFDFAFATGALGQLQAPFYRFPGTSGITLQPSALTGSITITFSAPYLTPDHVGLHLRYKNKQMRITGYTSPTVGTALVLENLPPSQRITDGSGTLRTVFFTGQVVEGLTSGATGEITGTGSLGGGGSYIDVVLNKLFTGFSAGETIVGPTAKINSINAASNISPQPSVEWDEIACSDLRGWPRSCLNDRNRLVFCDLPQLPEAIIWSAISGYDDFLVGADPEDAIFETAPGRARVLYMTGGPDQFVFTDKGVFYIPISETNPLKPGSVAFKQITSDAVGEVQPIATSEGTVFLNAGRSRVMAISQLGAATRPYELQDITDLYTHLIKSPICLAQTTGDGDFPERYVYVVNADGTMAVGRMETGKKWVGWVPWTGTGRVEWVSAQLDDAVLSIAYQNAPDTVTRVVEEMDEGALLDGQVFLNAMSPALNPPAGKGPLWMYAGLTVDLIDGLRDLGQREVNADGNLVLLPGDDFSAITVAAGLGFVPEFQPFIPHAQEGRDLGQTGRLRRIIQAVAKVQRSTGFVLGKKTIPRFDFGEEGGDQPVQRSATYKVRVLGRSVDPSFTVSRPRPGTLSLIELGIEVTV